MTEPNFSGNQRRSAQGLGTNLGPRSQSLGPRRLGPREKRAAVGSGFLGVWTSLGGFWKPLRVIDRMGLPFFFEITFKHLNIFFSISWGLLFVGSPFGEVTQRQLLSWETQGMAVAKRLITYQRCCSFGGAFYGGHCMSLSLYTCSFSKTCSFWCCFYDVSLGFSFAFVCWE